jgi:hypothetical protein
VSRWNTGLKIDPKLTARDTAENEAYWAKVQREHPPRKIAKMSTRSDAQELRLEIAENKYAKICSSVHKWRNYSDSEMRLHCGELTAQEIRSIKAVLQSIITENE